MKNRVIGLTGQTGAGKSTVAEFARELSCEVISADAVAREALEKGSDVLKTLADLFGCDIIDSEGNCVRSLLAQRAFSSRENTELLNRTTHPWIISRTREYIENTDPGRLIIFDAPQLFESGGEVLCGSVIAVVAPEAVRLGRIMERDGISREAALLRIRAQHDEAYYTGRADYLIDGSMPKEQVKRETGRIITELLQAEVEHEKQKRY